MLGFCSISSAGTYVDFSSLPYPVSFYNNGVSFPGGSILHQFGSIKIINKNSSTHASNPTILDSVVTDDFYTNSAIFFQGKLIFDVTNLPTHCRKVTFLTNTDSIFVDSHKYVVGLDGPFPIQIGDSARIEDPGDGSGIRVIGKFNTISIHSNQLSFPQSWVSDFLIQSCSETEFCRADFNYNIVENTVSLTNTSSVLADEAASFYWSFDGEFLDDIDDNVTYVQTEEGKYETCVYYSLNSCVNGGFFSKCDSIEITNDVKEINSLTNGSHYTLSPNEDGIQDYIDLLAGTKIFDRNGMLIVEIENDNPWIGTNYNNLPLPTGLYTAMYNNSKFNITIVR